MLKIKHNFSQELEWIVSTRNMNTVINKRFSLCVSHIKCKRKNAINYLDGTRWNFSFSRDGTTRDYGSRMAVRIIFVGEIGTRAIKFRNIDELPVRKRDN